MSAVLIIDDDLFVTNLYKTKLRNEGYQVEIANSGPEALSKLDDFRPNLLVLDLNMPEMNGVETLKGIRNQPGFENLPVIIFSNGHVQSLIDEVCLMGVQRCMIKSQCSPNRLVEEIRTILEALATEEEKSAQQTPLEAAVNVCPADAPAVSLNPGAHPEIQRNALVSLYRDIISEINLALKDSTESKFALLGSALKQVFEDLYDHPDHITEASIQTLMKGIENLKASAPKTDPAAALKNILESL